MSSHTHIIQSRSHPFRLAGRFYIALLRQATTWPIRTEWTRGMRGLKETELKQTISEKGKIKY